MGEIQTDTQMEKEAQALELSDFQELLQKEFKPKSDRMQQEVELATRTLAEYVLKDVGLVSADALRTIEAIKAAIDEKLTAQMDLILHHPDFQKLESAWRGLSYLVNNTETDTMLKIRVLNVSKDELRKTLKKYKGTLWDQSSLFKKIYGEEYDQPGGEPYGCLVGDYFFDHTPADVELLGEMAKIAAASHSPFITGAAPSVMQMESWSELSNPSDLAKIFTTPEYAAWRSLREADDSRYIGLAMPRFLARRPYGAKTEPVDEFDYEEDTEGADSSKYYLGELRLCNGCQHHQGLQALWLVFPHQGPRIRRYCGRFASAHIPYRRWRSRYEMPDRNRHRGPARGGTGQGWFHAAEPLEKHRLCRICGRAIPAKALPVRRPGRHSQRQSFRAPALPVRRLSLCPLPEVHSEGQNRLFQGAGRRTELAAEMDHTIR